ncbi:MAG: TIGR02679 family protein [Deltaproteobacteria bacterium]|nr:TIGR02679 family protein [Deltaproteobacteria bacterium]
MKLEALEPLRPMLAQVRDALEARGVDRARTLTLNELSAAQRRVLADLCGWPEVPSGPRVKLSLAKLDAALRDSAVGVGLVDAVTAMFGPLADRRAERAKTLAARETIWATARQRIEMRPALLAWLEDLRAHGRAARAATLSRTSEDVILDRALAVVARLPASGMLLPIFALDVLGDAHALDAGEPLSALVLRAAAALTSSPLPSNAVQRRRLWADVGVACDSLSADVLSLGLKPPGDGLLSRHLREASAEGVPRRTTLGELSGTRVTIAPGATVFICENPSVVAAAAECLGARVQPLVCVEGVPSTAGLKLLSDLSAGGAELRFHVDFDWGGLRIGNVLLEHLPAAKPWRLSAADYERSVTLRRGALELAGAPVEARWDKDLRPTLIHHGGAVLEEQVISDLLADLVT